ncbi:MAG: D-fructose-6-phosphate amidotransferase [Lentisphaerae bacterium RIFOXYA12_FULL_48_11]|nr:MAG: D-fructose-6-phosphate amidotransferase [Lentisphaerae bacterium RIFOXYA12_FULL_48_11]
MKAYVILDIDVKDPAGYEEYKKVGASTLGFYGGKPLARGGKTEVMEGNWQPKRVVMLEFESMDAAKKWWNSPEYAKAKKLRHAAAETNVVFLEGM